MKFLYGHVLEKLVLEVELDLRVQICVFIRRAVPISSDYF